MAGPPFVPCHDAVNFVQLMRVVTLKGPDSLLSARCLQQDVAICRQVLNTLSPRLPVPGLPSSTFTPGPVAASQGAGMVARAGGVDD